MGKPQEKKMQKGERQLRKKLHREELEKKRDKSAASLKGGLIYRKKASYSEMGEHARRAEEKV